VLQGVLVDVHHAVGIGEARLSNEANWLALWVDAASEEILLDNFAGVDVAHVCDLLPNGVALNLDHLPAEVHLNATLLALVLWISSAYPNW